MTFPSFPATMRYSSSRYRRKRMSANRPIVAFLLVSSFGILFAGCSAPADTDALEEFSFTAQDVERFREEVARDDTGTGSAPVLSLGSGAEIEVANTANQSLYDAIRSSSTSDTDLLKVTNTFLNLRSSPQVTASSLLQLQQGDIVSLLAFENAAWAHVRTLDGVEATLPSGTFLRWYRKSSSLLKKSSTRTCTLWILPFSMFALSQIVRRKK